MNFLTQSKCSPVQVHAAEGGSSTDRHGREARAGRLTRQKVRGVWLCFCQAYWTVTELLILCSAVIFVSPLPSSFCSQGEHRCRTISASTQPTTLALPC